ncbi:hypothetical protein Mapa_001019 [Marchantia paleacea]|nr:hypothetical protein Mapa_001019 [Marchantia paleacea]
MAVMMTDRATFPLQSHNNQQFTMAASLCGRHPIMTEIVLGCLVRENVHCQAS